MITESLAGQFDQQAIETLPDDALLEIFRFYLLEKPKKWFTLAHVCQRWRCLVCVSPRHLNLQLVCTGHTSPGEMLNKWPAWPINIESIDEFKRQSLSGSEVNYVAAALKHNNRVSKIKLRVGDLELCRLLAKMQEPFPTLECLDIQLKDPSASASTVIPDSFLGGSAPLLVHLDLLGIPFPGLQKLLLSTNHLVDLHLWDIPQAPYISPEVMAASLSAMKHLQSLHMGIRSRQVYERSIPVTRIVLPALKHLKLKCTGDYLEDLVARLDAPSLESMGIFYPSPSDVFDFSELPRFISRTKVFEMSDQSQLRTEDYQFELTVSQKMRTVDRAELSLIFAAREHGTLLSAFCSSLPPLYVEHLEIHDDQFMIPGPKMEDELREFSRRFHGVKNLFLDPDASVHVGKALKAFVEESLFPALQNIFIQEYSLQSTSARLLSSSTREAFLRFTAERRLAGLPVTLRVWEKGKRVEVRRVNALAFCFPGH
jgi:hypothetical protein